MQNLKEVIEIYESVPGAGHDVRRRAGGPIRESVEHTKDVIEIHDEVPVEVLESVRSDADMGEREEKPGLEEIKLVARARRYAVATDYESVPGARRLDVWLRLERANRSHIHGIAGRRA